jgi:hypothetical protein
MTASRVDLVVSVRGRTLRRPNGALRVRVVAGVPLHEPAQHRPSLGALFGAGLAERFP